VLYGSTTAVAANVRGTAEVGGVSRPTLHRPASRSRSGWVVHESGAVGEGDGLDAITESQFGEQVVDVGLDGGPTQEEGGGDLRVGVTVGDEPEDLELAWGEFGELGRGVAAGRWALDEAVEQAAGDLGGE
jgi:hypothetical protein